MSKPETSPTPPPASIRVLVILGLLALLSRLVFGMSVNPPSEHIYLDMEGYVDVARKAAEQGWIGGGRGVTFHAWGTAGLLAALMFVFGTENWGAIDFVWALFPAGTVVFSYLLACRVTSVQWVRLAAGVLVLLWYPVMLAGAFFLSEGPFTCLLVALTWRIVVLWQDERGALSVGVLGSLCFALRPEVVLFLGPAFLVFALRGHPAVTASKLARLFLPFALVLGFTLWSFQRHEGRMGVARSSALNLTLARCQVSRLQIFKNDHRVRYSQTLRDGNKVGPVGLWFLSELPEDHFFSPRPALGNERKLFELERPSGEKVLMSTGPGGRSIRWAGDMTDPFIHSELLDRCLKASGARAQLRASVINASLLWFFNPQWPDSSPRRADWQPYSDVYLQLFRWVFLVPALFGIQMAFRERDEDPELWFLALQLLAILITASIYFGSVRLRTPYDPAALILALVCFDRLRARLFT